MPHDLPKAYDPTAIEDHWAEYWVRENLFTQPPPADKPPAPSEGHAEGESQAFTILLPPPNVTGRLHMGHMLNQTEMDILMRWHRMRGEPSLWVPGTDHAGIATQMMVERQLASEGTSRQQLGRSGFEARVWQWRNLYGGAILDQMKRLGASVDWQREYFTMDANLSVAVREAFTRLYHQGLIYKGAYIVNWCPGCQTAISDLEVVHEETQGKLWEIKYPVAGSDGEFLVIATTRPETMLGDVAVAIHPEDERYQHLHGKQLILPLTGRQIPIVLDTWVSPEFGTGAVKVTPAHDPNDFALGQRHNLPSINVMDDRARIALSGSPYDGLDRYEARKRILDDLAAEGLLGAIHDHKLSLGRCDRSKDVVEPRLSEQWFVKIQPLADRAIEAVEKGYIQFTPDQYRKTWLNWMTNIHDWCISRQLWWGHRIPAWRCAVCHQMTVPQPGQQQDPVTCSHCGKQELTQETDVLDTWFSSGLLPVSVFGWPFFHPHPDKKTTEGAPSFRSPIAKGWESTNLHQPDPEERTRSAGAPALGSDKEAGAPSFRSPIAKGWESTDLHQPDPEERTRSAGAPALGSDKEAGAPSFPRTAAERMGGDTAGFADFDAFYPTTLLVTGFDILFFWVARMIMLGCWFALDVPMPDGSKRELKGAVPFRNVYIHALVRDANREKMSKTKGNVIDPIEIVKQYGTDAVRFTLASMASPGTDIAFNVARTEGYRAFANKIWNAARFLFMNIDRAKEAGIQVDPKVLGGMPTVGDDAPLEARWIVAEFHKAATEVNSSLADYRYDDAANTIYQFFWGSFCDWYLEIVKLRLNFTETAEKAATTAALTTLLQVFEASLRLLSPFMPFLTEEIWHAIYDDNPPAKSIALARFPTAPTFFPNVVDELDMDLIQELVSEVRTLRKEMSIEEKTPVPIYVRTHDEKVFRDNSLIIERLARVNDVRFINTIPAAMPVRSTFNFDVAVLFERTIDIPAERDRLTKEITKLEKNLASAEKQLGNESFLAKAPANIVEGLKKQQSENRELLTKAHAALTALSEA